MGKIIDLTGKKFGRLTVLKRAKNDAYGNAMWLCRCVCGSGVFVAHGAALRHQRLESCGCLYQEFLKEEAEDREYRAFMQWMQKEAREQAANAA